MADWKLLTYSDGGAPKAGVAIGDRIHDAATLLGRTGRSRRSTF